MEQITTVGIDLAKNVFSLHAVNANGKVALRRTVRRGELVQAVAALPPCVIGMEAYSGAHAWARQFERLGHTVRLMAPKFVIAYRKSGKNDGNAMTRARKRTALSCIAVDRAVMLHFLARRDIACSHL